MAKKYDAVIEAVRYAPTGEIKLVRVYERRGPVFSDRVLLTRQELIERLKAGKKFAVGQRVPYMASTFDVAGDVHLVRGDGKETVVSDDERAEHDALAGAPVF